MRCERCWSEEDVREEEGSTLCRPCRATEPEDPLVRETLFLPFASQKELLSHYQTVDLTVALQRWADQQELTPSAAVLRLLADEGALALFGRAAIRGMRPRRRTSPYGFQKKSGGLVGIGDEARTINAFFRMYKDGMSLRQIARAANRDDIPTSRGGQWRASTIRHILRNPIYVGRVRWGNMVREGGIPAIVDPDLFEAVQQGLTRRGKRVHKAIGGGSRSPPV